MQASEYGFQEAAQRDHWWYRVRRELLDWAMQKTIAGTSDDRHARVVDFGCGVGGNGSVLRAHARELIGVEPNAKARAFALQERGYDSVREDSVDSVDVLVAMDVLEHIEDDVAAMRRFHSMIRPGGWLVLTVPTFPMLWGLQDDVSHHVRRYRLPKLRALVRAQGFEIVESGYFNFFLFLPTLLARRVMRIFPPRSVQSESEINSPFFNRLFGWIFGADVRGFQKGLRYPFGVSAFVLARRPSERWVSALECPSCHTRMLDKLQCHDCGMKRPVLSGRPSFLSDDASRMADAAVASDSENRLKNFVKRWPKFYRVFAFFIAPVLRTGYTVEAFARSSVAPDKIVLNIGSGAFPLHPDVINVDLFPFENVDVVADATHLPFATGSVDAVCCDDVLEHVPRPDLVAAEIIRVLKPGGRAYIGVPFIYPYHVSPKDYTRWTMEGVAALFASGRVVKQGVVYGPVSGTLITLASLLALMVSFGWSPLYKLMKYVCMLLLMPFKFLDLLYSRVPNAHELSAGTFAIVEKPE